MEKRRLGESPLEITPVVFGAWAAGGTMWGGQDEEKAVRAVQASLDQGVNLVDTAPVYGFGRSEEIVGRAIRGRRDDVLVATKCGLRWDSTEGEFKFGLVDLDGTTKPIHHNLTPPSVREECEASLRRLGVDTIDLYQIHWPDPRTPLEETFAELVRLREEGKVRSLGVSNFSADQLRRALDLGDIVSDQPQFNLIDRGIESEILPWCLEQGVGVLAYSPMARGLLTGKVGPERELPPTDHRSGLPWFRPDYRRKVQEALSRVRPIAEGHGITLANLAVAWVTGEPGITAAIVGARDESQAAENARAMEVVLSEDERTTLREVFEGL